MPDTLIHATVAESGTRRGGNGDDEGETESGRKRAAMGAPTLL